MVPIAFSGCLDCAIVMGPMPLHVRIMPALGCSTQSPRRAASSHEHLHDTYLTCLTTCVHPALRAVHITICAARVHLSCLLHAHLCTWTGCGALVIHALQPRAAHLHSQHKEQLTMRIRGPRLSHSCHNHAP